jgi:succinate dehydrogenase/fumarate reductase flavoprotein subunit
MKPIEDAALTDNKLDVVIVGSGIAGTMAALQASRAGASVALLEKSDTFGGSAALSAGMYWTAPTVEAYRKRIPRGDERLGAHIVNHFDEGLAVLRDFDISVAETPTENIMTFGIGYSFDVRGFLAKAREEIETRGGTCHIGTSAVSLIWEKGAVTGVLAQRSEQEITFGSAVVILASGGFQGSPEELAQHMPHADALVFRSNPGSTGDGLNMARQIGVTEVGAMDSFYGHLLPYPLERFDTEHFLPYSQYYSESTVLLNMAGQRFIDETLGDEIINQALLREPDARGVMIFDEWVRKNAATSEPFPGLGELDRVTQACEAGGLVAQAPSLEELYELISAWGIDQATAANSIQTYNDFISHGDEDNEVVIASSARALTEAPFYAVMVQPSITFTFGGLPIDTSGRVLDNTGQPVHGLYAAGADIGGLSDVGYAGGLAPAFITGMTAGKYAATEALRSTPLSHQL